MAVGVIGIAKQKFAETIAATTAFQTWDDNNWSATQALDHIYFDALPPNVLNAATFDLDALMALRPFCVISKPDNMRGALSMTLQGTPNSFVSTGVLDAHFERNVPPQYSEDPATINAQFEEFMSLLMKSDDDAEPGIVELMRTGVSYLSVNAMEDTGPIRGSEEELPTHGDYQVYRLRVWWGPMRGRSGR